MFETNELIKKFTSLINEFSRNQINYLNELEKNRNELSDCKSQSAQHANMNRAAMIINSRSSEMRNYNQCFLSYA
jgi:hypothetical protein